MKERGGLVKHLKRFYNSAEETEKAICNYLKTNPSADNSQIFNDLSHKKGTGKSHHTYREGQIVDSNVRMFRRGRG